MSETSITQEYVKQCYDYDMNTGVLTWRQDRPKDHFSNEGLYKRWKTQCAGEVVGSYNNEGYLMLSLSRGGKKTTFSITHIIYLWMEGRLPEATIDHLNSVKDDNRWANLEACSLRENNSRKEGYEQMTTAQVHKICKLLSTTNKSFNSIAIEVGVASTNSVRRIFTGDYFKDISRHYDFSGYVIRLHTKMKKTYYSEDVVIKVCEQLQEGERVVDIARGMSTTSGFVQSVKSRRSHKKISDNYIW